MTTAFDLLHRSVQRKLWDMQWTELRSIQDQAIRHLLIGGGDAVIASPTASGKTEAAFLPILSAIAETPSGSVRAMYIGPLKALINDQFRRVEDLCTRIGMPVCKWHGDVNDAPKQRLLDSPSGILLITPESLEAMLVRRPTAIPKLFSKLAYVVVDEMHAFIGTERGAQLVSQLHRLRRRAGCDPVRIGLSATLGDPDATLRWLRPGAPPATLIHHVGARSAIQIKVRGIWARAAPKSPAEDDASEDTDPSDIELARGILLACHGKTNLVFANAKSKIEILADALLSEASVMKLPDEIVVHHGSLSRERRLHAEERLRTARACTAVCSNTLELGIDIGKIDEVVQVSAPWSVASLVQRVGRSGRRDDAPRILRGYFVERVADEESDLWDRLHLDLVQGIATVELMLERFIEPPALGRAHLSTLVHQCLAFLAETGGTNAVLLFKAICGSGAFGDLSSSDFAAVLRELGRRDLIQQMGDGTLVVGLAGQKLVEHYTFFAAFNAPEELRVVHNGEEIGAIAEPPAPGEHLILAGRRWRVELVDIERREVLVTPARGARAPRFTPSRAAVHPAIHAKMKTLLLGENRPAYLDPVALEMLEDARSETAKHDGFRPSARVFEQGVRLFVFAGSKVQRTLSLVLSRAGLDAADADVGFDVDAAPLRIADALRAFARAPDLAALAEHAERVLLLREFGREKFDRFVAPAVWQRAYAREELDERGAAAAALQLADALRGTHHSFATPDHALAGTTTAALTAPAAAVQHLAAAPPDRARVPSPGETLGTMEDLCALLEKMPASGPLPVRLVIVANEMHAHAIRRHLARTGRGRLLIGTRLLSTTQLALEILHTSGTAFSAGEELVRSTRLREIFRRAPPLRYFNAGQLAGTPGWDQAFARTISELEAAALTPDLLGSLTEDARIRDIADLWSELERAADRSWTRSRIIKEAALALSRDISLLGEDAQGLVVLSGHEPRVDAELARALPRAQLSTWAARPRRPAHAERMTHLFGAGVGSAWAACSTPVTPDVRSELSLLKAFLFEDPELTSAPNRIRSAGRDGSVELEHHDSFEAELDATLTWVEGEVRERGTPLEEIAIIVPTREPMGGMLAERFAELDLPAHVVGGLRAVTKPACTRILTALRALTTYLARDRLIELAPTLRLSNEQRRQLTRREALEALGSLGVLGGSRSKPEEALEWQPKLAERVKRIDAALTAAPGAGDEHEEERRTLERTRDILRSIELPISALTAAVEPFVRGAHLAELWTATETFLREHVSIPADGARVVEAFAAAMRELCERPSLAALSGTDAHHLLEETVLQLRFDSGRFGDAAITIATAEDAAGLPFTAVRILGLAEGILPGTPREDAVLPDALRRELKPYGLRDRGDRALAQLHAVDRIVRHVSERVVFSMPQRDIGGTYRELSPVGVEIGIALGRGGVQLPRASDLHASAFAPAQEALVLARDRAPLRQATWQRRGAIRRELPASWTEAPCLDIARGMALLDVARPPDALDGIFQRSGGWFPTVPGSSPARPLSASRWRVFLECPHRFLYEVLLGLKSPVEDPDEGELDPLTYGTLFHTVAERFYARHGEAFVRRDGDVDSFDLFAQAIADEAFAEVLDRHALAGSAVRAAQRERLRRDVRGLVELEWQLTRERIVAVERGFGTETPLAITSGAHRVYVRGYVDRIDLEDGVTVLRDLKTGKPKPRKEAEEPDPSTDAQLALYTLAARALRDAWQLSSRMAATYVYPSGARHTERAFRDADHLRLETAGGEWLGITAELTVTRSFPRTPEPKDCARCAFKPVCGPGAAARAKSVLSTGAPGLAAFAEMKAR